MLIGTRADNEVFKAFAPFQIHLDFFPPNSGSVTRKIKRFLTEGSSSCLYVDRGYSFDYHPFDVLAFMLGYLMDIKILERCVRANIPDWTFAEAYERTGRIINIVVSPSGQNKDAPRLYAFCIAQPFFFTQLLSFSLQA